MVHKSVDNIQIVQDSVGYMSTQGLMNDGQVYRISVSARDVYERDNTVNE